MLFGNVTLYDGDQIELDDFDTQTVGAQAGIRLRPYRIRYLFPAQLDALAADAGLRLVDRWASWDASPFTADSPNHVSVYARADA